MPINLIIQKIKDKPESIAAIISKYARAVIVTKDEDEKITAKKLHKRMTGDFESEDNLLCRYKEADILKIYDIRENEIINQYFIDDRKTFKEKVNQFV